MPVYLLITAFTLTMAVHCVKTGRAGSWLWIILVFGPIGSAVYFFSEFLEDPWFGRARSGPRKPTSREAQRGEAEARRLDTAGAWASAAHMFRQRSEFTRAVGAARNALARKPQDVEARFELGMALLGDHHAAEAAQELAQVVEKDPGYANGDALWALSQARQQTGDLPGARASLEKLTERSARAEVLYELALVQGRLGDREAARQNLHRIIDEAAIVPDYLQRQIKPWVRKAEKGLQKLDEA
jgi:hypothetical protein